MGTSRTRAWLAALAATAMHGEMAAAAGTAAPTAPALRGSHQLTEAWIAEPMPPRFRVVVTELDGPVFADARGRTLYTWPFKNMRVGATGDPKGQSNCGSTVRTSRSL